MPGSGGGMRFRSTAPRLVSLLVCAAAGAGLVLGLGGVPARGQTERSAAGGVSGSFGDRGDAYLSFSIAGGNLKLRPGTNNVYEGTWNGGRVTLSGEMTVSRSAGTVSYVTMTARINDKSWQWPSASGSGKVEGKTVTQRYSLSYTVPAGPAGPVTGSARLEVCGGVCGTYEVLFTIDVGRKAPLATTPTTPKPKPKGLPTVRAFAPRGRAEPGKPITLEYSVNDPSGRATAHLFLYQGGDRVMKGSGRITADGKRKSTTPTLPATLVGPLFFCVWAENAQGKRSAGSPKSSCAWIPFVVPIKRVSNGCGGEGWDTLVKIENYFGNEHTYVDSNVNPAAASYPVDFVKACDLHDAGYVGVMVEDEINGGIVDYRSWSRKRVDDKFYLDMAKLCNAAIPPTAKIARVKCKGKGGPASIGARMLHGFVRKYGWHFFDADLTTGGVQSVANRRARPRGGARDNFP